MQKMFDMSHRFFRTVFGRYAVIGIFVVAPLLSNNVLADNAEDTLDQTDILKVGDNMYTEARKWETKDIETYEDQENAFTDFSKRMDAMIRADRELYETFEKYCENDCSYYIDQEIEENEELKKYLKTSPGTDANLLPISFIIQNGCSDGPCFHTKIKEGLDKNSFPEFMHHLEAGTKAMVDSIRKQIKEQIVVYKDIGGMGIYYDGYKDEEDESDYDLMADLKKIDEVLFRKVPGFGDYQNTSPEEQKELIKQEEENGGGGSSNNTDSLASEVQKKTGTSSSSSNSSISSVGQAAEEKNLSDTGSDSENGKSYKNTVDRKRNTDYITTETEGKNSFQGIFEDGLSWLIQHGDNRNLACQVSPTINFLESVLDQVDLRDVFAGSTIFPSLTSYNYYAGFHNRKMLASNENQENSSNSQSSDSQSGSSSGESQSNSQESTEDYQTEIINGALESAFRRYSLNLERPTNLKGSDLQGLFYYGLVNASNYAMISDTHEAIVLASWAGDYLTAFHGLGADRANINKNVNASTKHLEYINEEMEIRARMFSRLVERLWQILDYILDKKECPSGWGTTET